jgi:hypothetical protein
MTACLFLLSRTAIVRSWTSCALVVTPLLACVPALGASQADYDQCLQNVDQDRRIAGCTRVIDDAGESNRNRQLAYDNRGTAWHYAGRLVGHETCRMSACIRLVVYDFFKNRLRINPKF